MTDKTFLFEYRFAGAEWGIQISAADAAEAREKIRSVALAHYKGEVAMTIPAAPGAGLLAGLVCWWRNRR
jgi:hypothetical protein